MEEVTPGNGKIPGGDRGPSGDEAIRLLSKLAEIMELVHRLDRRWYEQMQEKRTLKEATKDN